MKLIVKYFGKIAEVIGFEQELLETKNESFSLNDLRLMIISRNPELNDINFKLAVNLTLTNENIKLKNSDEISFLPPFSGG